MEAKEPPVGFPPTLTALKPPLSMLDDGGNWSLVIGRTGTIPLSATDASACVSGPKLDPAFSPSNGRYIPKSRLARNGVFFS